MSDSVTVASPALTPDVAAATLAWMGAQSGVVTDYNTGSQLRTLTESMGSVVEMEGVIAQALAFQATIYGALSAFGITQESAKYATGTATFATASSSPPAATQDVLIPSGTIIQTDGGIQFQTTESVTLASGTTSIDSTIEAVVAGVAGNVNASTIDQIVSGLPYPLVVSNSSATSGGADKELPSQTLTRFAAKIGAIGGGSPQAVADSVIGVQASGSNSTVQYSTCYEEWLALGNTTAGFTVYIDDGSGTASSGLISAAQSVLDGVLASGTNGYRPAGVPYSVAAVTPTDCSTVISGTLVYSQFQSQAETAASNAQTTYFDSLQFGDTAEIAELNAAIANSVAGYVKGLTVTLKDHTGTSVSSVTTSVSGRIHLTSTTVTFS